MYKNHWKFLPFLGKILRFCSQHRAAVTKVIETKIPKLHTIISTNLQKSTVNTNLQKLK